MKKNLKTILVLGLITTTLFITGCGKKEDSIKESVNNTVNESVSTETKKYNFKSLESGKSAIIIFKDNMAGGFEEELNNAIAQLEEEEYEVIEADYSTVQNNGRAVMIRYRKK